MGSQDKEAVWNIDDECGSKLFLEYVQLHIDKSASISKLLVLCGATCMSWCWTALNYSGNGL